MVPSQCSNSQFMMYNPQARYAYGIMNGSKGGEIEIFKERLLESMEHADHSVLVPLILFEQKIHHFAQLLEI